MSRPATVRLRKPLRSAVLAGHPWLYRRAVDAPAGLEAGAVVAVQDDGGFLAWGLYDPEHPIAVRVTGLDPDGPPGPNWATTRLAQALAARQRSVAPYSDAYRVLHGEADGTPGWALDRYGDVWVVRPDGAAAMARLDWLVQAVVAQAEQGGVAGLVLRRSRGAGGGPKAELLWGEVAAEAFGCREHHWQMEVDVWAGQKTGWFLDQRDNRRRIFELASGARVLNLFSYTGGFSLAAALGGAAQVVSVDVSGPAIAAAERNFARNGLVPDDYEFHAADAFRWLDAAVADGRRFELIVVDPPSFAPNERSVPQALKAYERLIAGAFACLAPGGIVAAASCSSHVSDDAFRGVLSRAARLARQRLALLGEFGAGLDHPTLPAFPEGRYLKFMLVHAVPTD